jgi:uncharacterized RDD family membrane protein YckC
MSPESVPETRFCTQCGRPFPQEELARFGEQLVCASCKDLFTQRLREGAVTGAAQQFAGFWVRVGASLIDAVILFVLQMAFQAVFLPLFSSRNTGSMLIVMGLSYIFSITTGALYEALLIARYAATPGKMALGLKVVRTDGSAVSLGRAFGRHFSKMISAMILLIGYIMVAFDDQKRGLHDMICDTRVVKAR